MFRVFSAKVGRGSWWRLKMAPGEGLAKIRAKLADFSCLVENKMKTQETIHKTQTRATNEWKWQTGGLEHGHGFQVRAKWAKLQTGKWKWLVKMVPPSLYSKNCVVDRRVNPDRWMAHRIKTNRRMGGFETSRRMARLEADLAVGQINGHRAILARDGEALGTARAPSDRAGAPTPLDGVDPRIDGCHAILAHGFGGCQNGTTAVGSMDPPIQRSAAHRSNICNILQLTSVNPILTR